MQNGNTSWPIFLRQNILSGSEILGANLKSFEASIFKYLEFHLIEWTQLAKPKTGGPDYDMLLWLEPASNQETHTWAVINFHELLMWASLQYIHLSADTFLVGVKRTQHACLISKMKTHTDLSNLLGGKKWDKVIAEWHFTLIYPKRRGYVRTDGCTAITWQTKCVNSMG